MLPAADGDGVKLDLQQRSPFEFAGRMSRHHRAGRGRAGLDHSPALDFDRIRQGSGEALSRLAFLGAQRLAQTNGDHRAGGNDQPRSRFGGSRSSGLPGAHRAAGVVAGIVAGSGVIGVVAGRRITGIVRWRFAGTTDRRKCDIAGQGE